MAGEFFASFLEALSQNAGVSFRDARQQAVENARLALQQEQGAEHISIARQAEKGRGTRSTAEIASRAELAKSNRELAVTLGGTFKQKSKQELEAIAKRGGEARKTATQAASDQKIIDMLRSGRSLNNILAQMEKGDELAIGAEKRGESAEIRALERGLEKEKRLFKLKVFYERDMAEQMNELQTKFLPDEKKRIIERARAKGEVMNDLQITLELARGAINAKPDPFVDLMLRERFGIRQPDGTFRVPTNNFFKLLAAREQLRAAGSARVISQVMGSVEGDAEGTRTAIGVLRDALLNTPVEQLIREMKEAFPDITGGPPEAVTPIQDSGVRRQAELDSGVKPDVLARTYSAVPEWARMLGVLPVAQYGIDPNVTAAIDAVASNVLEIANSQRTKGGGITTGHHTIDLQRIQLVKMPFSKDLPLDMLGVRTRIPIKSLASGRIDAFGKSEALAGPKALFEQFKEAQLDPRSGIGPGDPINKWTIARLITWQLQAQERGDRGRLVLTPEQQVRHSSVRKTETFDKWWNRFAFINDLNANPDNPAHHFDYRGYYQAAKANPKAFSPVYDPVETQVNLPPKFKAEELDPTTGKPVEKKKDK